MNILRVGVRRVSVGLCAASVLSLTACGGGSTNDEISATAASTTTTRQTIAATAVAAARVTNGDFESPMLPDGTYVYAPTNVAGWTFSDSAVLTTMGSAFTKGTPDYGTSRQVVALQNNGEISQTMTFNVGAMLRFRAIQRQNHRTGPQRVSVWVDGVYQQTVADFAYDSAETGYGKLAIPADHGWAQYTVLLTVGASGPHKVTIRGVPPGTSGQDVTVFIDDVHIVYHNGVYSYPEVSNGSFELPVLGSGQYAYRPEGSGWTLSGGAAIASNGSAFFRNAQGGTVYPSGYGNQVLFMQQNASASQVLELEPGDHLSVVGGTREDWTILSGPFPQLSLYVNGQKQPVLSNSDLRFNVSGGVNFSLPGVIEAGKYTVELRTEQAAPYSDRSILIDHLQLSRYGTQ